VKSANAGAPKSQASTTVPQQPTETPQAQEVQTANRASVWGTVPAGGFDTRWGAMR
jgi:hypothetical protein